MKILKFGGSSVGSPERIQNVVNIIVGARQPHLPVAVVVSALQGITNQLLEVGALASRRDSQWLKFYEDIREKHTGLAQTLLSGTNREQALAWVETLVEELGVALREVFSRGQFSPAQADRVMSFGERLSAYIVARTLRERGVAGEYLDAREVVKTDDSFGRARVYLEESYGSIRARFATFDPEALPVVTGFIGATEEGETTTLGRGGSDYTAAILGAALEAAEIEIWTDVDGVMTADPRLVRDAFPIPYMTYEEAMEMAHFGAKVIYPPTIQPAQKKNIPIRIKNTFQPACPGTLINAERPSESLSPVTGISSVQDIALIRIAGPGMVGVAGIAGRLFGALARRGVNVILISQASSEHSICFAVAASAAGEARQALADEFRAEMERGDVEEISAEADHVIIAAVGRRMRKTPGIAGKIFRTLGDRRVNVVAIAQGSSEMNISIAVAREDHGPALEAIHDTFFTPAKKEAHVFLLGTGKVAATLLEELAKKADALPKNDMPAIRLLGIMNRRRMVLRPEGIPAAGWREALDTGGGPADLDAFLRAAKAHGAASRVLVDCTAADETGMRYQELLESGISVVTPNKRANAGPYATYRALRDAARQSGAKYFYSANVGAGLPVLRTIRELAASGDRIHRIEGILSGTLSFVFNVFAPGVPLSRIVRHAQELGYTEPDPREDLNGLDVARKLLIMAREMGLPLELEDIAVEDLVPKDLRALQSPEDFLRELQQFDGLFEARRCAAEKRGKALRYMATLTNGDARVALGEVEAGHPFAQLSGSDNIVSFTTDRYGEQPLIIRGPGAGPRVTAGAVVADILRVAEAV